VAARMNKIDRYIIWHLYAFIALVGFALISIYSFIGFLSDMDDVGKGNFGIVQLIVYTFMTMPSGFYILLPIIAMLGTLMGLGTLAGQSELTAMRASGVSLLRLGATTLGAGLVLGLFGYVLGDWIAPQAQRAALDYKFTARDGYASQSVQEKAVWLRDGDSVFHIKQLITQDHIADLEIFTLAPDMSLSATYHVKDARYESGEWHFSDIHKTALTLDSAVTSDLPQMVWKGALSPEVLRLLLLKADSLTMPGLLRLIRYLDGNQLDSTRYRTEMWRKLVAPVTVMSLMLFAIPFVLGAPRSSGAGQRLLIGILIGVGFYIFNEVSVNLGQIFQWPPFLAATTPTLLLGAAGFYRLSRIR
jgi:lipopolysaccharide export system permease protein